MKKILLDTNVLMGIGTLRLDVFSEIERICDFRHEIVTLDSVVEELRGIAEKQKDKYRKAAKLALKILEHKKVRVLKSGIMPADEAILRIADDDFAVATQDAELKRKLRANGTEVIVIRQKKYMRKG